MYGIFNFIVLLFCVIVLLLKPYASAVNITTIYRDYLQNVVDAIDESVGPCDNFFLHACSKMNLNVTDERDKESEENNHQQRIHPFLYNHQDYYEFFESYKSKFQTKPGIVVRDLYELCKEAHIGKVSPRRVWLYMINDIPLLEKDRNLLRKWPFLQYQWESYERQLNLNWPLLAAEFAAHGFEIFFNIFFAENTIYITRNKDFLCPSLENFQDSLLPLLRLRNPQIATIIGTEIWQFCRQLKGEIPLSNENLEVTDFLLDETMSDFLQCYFARLNLTDKDIEEARKIVVNVHILSEMMAVLKATNPRIVYNYVVWHVYQQLMEMNDCFTLTDEFQYLLQFEYWQWSPFEGHFRREVAMATFLFHTTRFQRHYRNGITSSSVERLFQRRSQRKDLNIERSIRNYAKELQTPEKFSSIYEIGDITSKTKFYSHLLELRRLTIRHTFYNSYVDLEDMNFFQEFINFSILLLFRPRMHYFATYDRKMWLDSKLLQNSDGLLTAMDCLDRQSLLHADDYGELYETLKMDQVTDVFNFYTAFVESIADYNFWLESENFAMAEDIILEYFHLDSVRIMYYVVAQQLCLRNDALYSTVINRSFMNMPEFQRVFECTEDDPMNPLPKCLAEK
ncbi:neprilysin-like 9 [Musca autumnalis]|uniref:neprilysin-like 9 n=1 Tax=Musca autumnalis TaxID=221902 RepID=UPI003CEEA719